MTHTIDFSTGLAKECWALIHLLLKLVKPRSRSEGFYRECMMIKSSIEAPTVKASMGLQRRLRVPSGTTLEVIGTSYWA